MKRILSVILSLCLLVFAATGCTQGSAAGQAGDKLNIVCTIFPQYDWVRQILGDKASGADISFLMGSGVDLHSYQPSADDIVKISSCDLFIYVGGESDAWVEEALKDPANPQRVVIKLLDALGDAAKLEELVPGMQDDEHEHEGEHDGEGEHEDEHEDEHDEDHEGEGEHEDDHSHEGEAVYDEHVWLSLKNAQTLCGAITTALCDLDAASADTYKANLAAYEVTLAALDAQYQQAVDAAPVKTLLFGDRFPFRYLVEDYGIAYRAAFPGCSAETKASFDTIIFLAGVVDDLSLKNVMVLESSDQSIANTIIESTAAKDQQILVLDSMQSITQAGAESDVSYLSIMESNLTVLKDALS